jgi:hypothetical protein
MKRCQLRNSKGADTPSRSNNNAGEETAASTDNADDRTKSPQQSQQKNQKKRKRGDVMDLLKNRRMAMQTSAEPTGTDKVSTTAEKLEVPGQNTNNQRESTNISTLAAEQSVGGGSAEVPIEPSEEETTPVHMARFNSFVDVAFDKAIPSPTHMAIQGSSALMRARWS